VLFAVCFDKQWNIRCRAPLFRMHKMIGHSFSFELSREERNHLTDFWHDEIEKDNNDYLSYQESKKGVFKHFKMLPKTMILRFVGYIILLISGLLFVLIPSHLRHKALKHCGLSDHKANLIWLLYLTMTMMGELCQLLAQTTILKREPSTLRCLGFDRAPLKFVVMPCRRFVGKVLRCCHRR